MDPEAPQRCACWVLDDGELALPVIKDDENIKRLSSSLPLRGAQPRGGEDPASAALNAAKPEGRAQPPWAMQTERTLLTGPAETTTAAQLLGVEALDSP